MKTRAVKASRTGLLKAKVRDWQEKSTYTDIFIVPTRKRHDSGWMLMAIVGLKADGTYEQAAWCDDVCWNVASLKKDYTMRNDCTYPGGIIHYWGANFTVGCSLSSTDITVTELVREKVPA